MNAAFFDLDGTLFDTRADLAATVNHTRRDLGLAELPAESVIACVGQGARYLLTHAIPECVGDAADERIRRPFEDVWEVFRSHYAEHCVETLTPYPDVIRTLAELKDRGWLLGMVTNKPNFATRLIVEKFGMRRFFGNGIVAGGDCAALKPDALPLRECASRVRVQARGAQAFVARLDGGRFVDGHAVRRERRREGRFLRVRLRAARRLALDGQAERIRRATSALESRGLNLV